MRIYEMISAASVRASQWPRAGTPLEDACRLFDCDEATMERFIDELGYLGAEMLDRTGDPRQVDAAILVMAIETHQELNR